MRILKKDLQNGLVRLRVENADDLWILRSVIQPGDKARASTERKLKLGDAKEGKASVVRKRITLTIAVEKVEYQPGTLRVLGTITDGPDTVPRGEHHSFGFEPGSEFSLRKQEWPRYLLTKLEEATKENAAILVLLFDREEAKLYSVTRCGVEEVLRLKGRVAKKEIDEKGKSNFYQEIVAALREREQKYRHIVAGAPAFWKEYLEQELPPQLKKKTVLTTISAVERTAIRELLARPEVAKLLAENATLRELQLAEETLEALGKDKLAYGPKEVAETINAGNAAKVLVTDKEIEKRRDNDSFHALEALLKTAETTKAEVHVLSSEEAMGKLDPLGGVVAIKRW